MNEFCVLVNITPGRSPEGEFLVSHRETMKLYPQDVGTDREFRVSVGDEETLILIRSTTVLDLLR